jgi:hypothetical protein
MDHFIGGEKLRPPSAASKRKPRVILGQILLGFLIGLSPVCATLLGFLLIVNLLRGSDITLNDFVIRLLPVVYWIFWVCFGTAVVIILIKALNKRRTFLAGSLPALTISLACITAFTALMQIIHLSLVQPIQWSNSPPHVIEQPGQVINDDASNLSLTYLSAHKTTDASNGLIYITVHIRITNTSPSSSAITYSASFFVKSTNTSKSEDAINPENTIPDYRGNSLLSEKNNPIDPNATIEGDIAFSCLPDQNPDQFAWDPNFDSGQQGVKVYVWKLIV